jgi:hypothetical protein
MYEKEIAVVAEGVPKWHRPCGVGQERIEISKAVENVSAVGLAEIK